MSHHITVEGTQLLIAKLCKHFDEHDWELAVRMGFHYETIERILAGEQKPQIETRNRILEFATKNNVHL